MAVASKKGISMIRTFIRVRDGNIFFGDQKNFCFETLDGGMGQEKLYIESYDHSNNASHKQNRLQITDTFNYAFLIKKELNVVYDENENNLNRFFTSPMTFCSFLTSSGPTWLLSISNQIHRKAITNKNMSDMDIELENFYIYIGDNEIKFQSSKPTPTEKIGTA